MEKEGILLEQGTNEFEMLSFVINNCVYGVNVSKVSEVIKYQHITPIPGTDTRICGIFMPRDEIISVVDLRYCLIQEKSTEENSEYMIICRFNKHSVAYPVDSVIGINRISWSELISPSKVINSDEGVITGIVKLDDKIISILDLEKIMTDININNGLTIKDVENLTENAIQANIAKDIHVLLAEDSKMLNKLISDGMQKAGYKVLSFENGKLAYDYLTEHTDDVNIIVSDIEMPEMDGMAFLKACKTDKNYQKIPFIIFSSLVSDTMQAKCESLGVDKCLAKPELQLLLDALKEFQ